MFKSVICVDERDTYDLTGPTYKYWVLPELLGSQQVLYYRWDGSVMMVRVNNSKHWSLACATYNELLAVGNPVDANTAEIP